MVFIAHLALCLAPQQDEKVSVKDFAWLAGVWTGKTSDGDFEEHWTTPVGDRMIGMGRCVNGDQTVFTEFLILCETKSGIYYCAQVGDQPAVAFKLTKWKDGEAVFENPKHDFPQKITYKKEKDGSVTARIEGDMGGQPVKEEFKLKAKK